MSSEAEIVALEETIREYRKGQGEVPQHVRLGRALAAKQNGPGAEIVSCPKCDNPRRKFLIIEGRCDSCRTTEKRESEKKAFAIGWEDVRQRRTLALIATDFSQVADYPSAKASAYALIRSRLRDITTLSTPAEAWDAVAVAEQDIALLSETTSATPASSRQKG